MHRKKKRVVEQTKKHEFIFVCALFCLIISFAEKRKKKFIKVNIITRVYRTVSD